MPQCVVVADDLTGANATGVKLRDLNLRTATLVDTEQIRVDALSEYDVVTCPTESRYIDERWAYQRVFATTALFKGRDVKVFNKRIDSTLRGNLGAEIDGMLDGLGDHRVAMVVPSYPQAGRIAVGGYMLVHGTALCHTDVAKDPKIPITTSDITKLIGRQTRYRADVIPLDAVCQGERAVREKILGLLERGTRVIIFDALDDGDILTIAKGTISSKTPFISVCPGPFVATLANLLITPKADAVGEKILMVLGSVTEVARLQMKETFNHLKGRIIEVDAGKLILAEDARSELERAAGIYEEREGEYDLSCITTQSLRGDAMLDLREISRETGLPVEDISLRISRGLAKIAHRIIVSHGIKALFSSGGDTTAALYRVLGAQGIELKREVEPLVAYGSLVGGERHGLKVVTKGGMAGSKDSIKNAIIYLREHIKT